MAFFDRSWMYRFDRDRNEHIEFHEGLRIFLEFALKTRTGVLADCEIACPCTHCRNGRWERPHIVGKHLLSRGFVPDYFTWYAQGERNGPPQYLASSSAAIPGSPQQETGNDYEGHGADDFDFAGNSDEEEQEDSDEEEQEEAAANPFQEPSETVQQGHIANRKCRRYLEMMNDKNVPLNNGTNKTLLQYVAELFGVKLKHKLSIEAFNQFMDAIRPAMPLEIQPKFPVNFYQTRKFFEEWRLDAIKYDVCYNDCLIYRGRQRDLTVCPFCGVGRYKTRRVGGVRTETNQPRKRLWYFPIIPRLQRLFYCRKVAKAMTWHLACRDEHEEIIHPAGGEAWKKFDQDYPDFAKEGRNPRLGFCTDGVNPFDRRGTYSIWPVFLTVYNLPPEMCMKPEFIFLTMIIQGSLGPGKNLDVYLRPLIEDLNTLWHEGVKTYDVYARENFTMKAAVVGTITDFPGYGMVSSWSTHGKLSCPVCMDFTTSRWLPHGKKHSWFDRHRPFLPLGHEHRTDTVNFWPGEECDLVAPPRRDGDSVYTEVFPLHQVIPGKSGPKNDNLPGFGTTHNWVQRSIFWELEYWPSVLVRHNLDLMHIEKNFFDNLLFTLLDEAKSKDNTNTRLDLAHEGFESRSDLFLTPHPRTGKLCKPEAQYTVNSREDKEAIFEWVRKLRFPDGYASNLANCFNGETLQVTGMKSHDNHVFLQRLLPIAFDMLPDNVWQVLAEISMFFRRLGAPRILASEMRELEVSIVDLICRMEKIFPPSFFDVMEHLPIHLPYEARVGGPVQYRWMYPFERRMHTIKQDTKNKARPEGSICEAYLDMEVVNFCALYFDDDVDSAYNGTMSRNQIPRTPYSGPMVFACTGKAFGPKNLYRELTQQEYVQAYLYILYNCDEVDPLQSEFDNRYCQGMDFPERRQYKEIHFIPWFQGAVARDGYGTRTLLADLARGPSANIRTYKGYRVKGYRFHTESYGATKGTSNSGVCLKGTTDAAEGTNDFFGVLLDIVQLEFGMNSVVLFKCKWYDTATEDGVWTNKALGLIEINPRRRYPINEPFVLAEQVSQVYYTEIPGTRRGKPRKNWWAVFKTRSRHVIEGFTGDQTEEEDTDTSDEDNDPHIANPRGVVFQDAEIPRMVLRSGREITRITRSTGRLVAITEPVNLDPAPPPPTDEAFDFDDVVEEHSSDSDT